MHIQVDVSRDRVDWYGWAQDVVDDAAELFAAEIRAYCKKMWPTAVVDVVVTGEDKVFVHDDDEDSSVYKSVLVESQEKMNSGKETDVAGT